MLVRCPVHAPVRTLMYGLPLSQSDQRIRSVFQSVYSIPVSENPSFCVADFATLSDERRSRSKIFLLFIWIKEPCVRQFEGLARSKLLEISQTDTIISRMDLNKSIRFNNILHDSATAC